MKTVASTPDRFNNTYNNRFFDILVFLVIGVALAFIVLVLILVRRFRRKLQAEKERKTKTCIYPYLQGMDPKDVHLFRAPTGGWHGTYMNKLADGVNEYDTDHESFTDEEESSDDEHEVVVFHHKHEDPHLYDGGDLIDDIIHNTESNTADYVSKLSDERKRISSLLEDNTSSSQLQDVPIVVGCVSQLHDAMRQTRRGGSGSNTLFADADSSVRYGGRRDSLTLPSAGDDACAEGLDDDTTPRANGWWDI